MRSPRKRTGNDFARFNINTNVVFAMPGMKMRRGVIVVVHCDDTAQQHTILSAQTNQGMNQHDFESLIRQAMHDLPEWVQNGLDNVEILVVEEADENLDPEGEGLLGLYVGTPLPERGIDYAGELPDVIYIFRRPHLELDLPPDELQDEIVKTLIHEIAHYFGIDDDHLDEIGWG